LASILSIATDAKGRPDRNGLLSQFELVAGEGFEPSTFRL
jgi:hypothetical protein